VETLERVLAEHPFFSRMDPRYLELVVGCASNLLLNAGEFIFREGEEADHFYLIREGKVFTRSLHSRSRPPDHSYAGRRHEILGWSWLVPPYYWRFDARAKELTRAIVLDGKCLRDKCEADHELGYELLKHVVSDFGRLLDATRFRLLAHYGFAT
jgi:CRP/FNR family cyclic AMP-dependent transcriptional regulator